MLEDGGSISWASGVAAAFARAAQDALPAAFSGARDGADLSFVRDLVRYLVERDV